jgi:hypothetical protein
MANENEEEEGGFGEFFIALCAFIAAICNTCGG